MILMYAYLDNIGQFTDFECDFSYARKVKNYTLDSEFLQYAPSFRYRKLVILMGPNASGKTSFGRAIIATYNLVYNQKIKPLADMIADKTKSSHVIIDVVNKRIGGKDDYRLSRFDITIDALENPVDEITPDNIHLAWSTSRILESDTYERSKSRLSEPATDSFNSVLRHRLFYVAGWRLSVEEEGNQLALSSSDNAPNIFFLTLKNILMSLDPSIKSVTRLTDENGKALKGAYSVEFPNRSVLIQQGEPVTSNLLSRGTKTGIEIAEFVASVITHLYGFYYCDEKFAYIQTDFEQAILALMAVKLGDCEQLFFTTHNTDVLDLNFPRHSYLFFTKSLQGGKAISPLWANDYANKSDKLLRKFVDSDVFMTHPNLEKLIELEDLPDVTE